MMDTNDSNSDLQIRPLNCELNLLTRSDGSALFTQGETSIISSVSGPIEVKLQNLSIEKASVEVYYRPKTGYSGVNDRLKEQIIRNTCESAILATLHPRTAISIQLQEMADCAGLLACSINASCLALLNSGISMKFLIAAVNCIIDRDGELVIDPDHRQSKDFKSSFTFVFDSVGKNLITIYTSGKFSHSQYTDAFTVCREASNIIFEFYKSIIKKFSSIL